ncbi:oligosaccharide flippase family protein [Thiothrix lacustris]|uniref:oligosaccharide flippase family protein n=1 Tax=Thiothrix lacustris TaxID=525917 RepID=UPI0027E526DD|nr:oligosaccharide flippase family protein [Thiothrix lacustris]WMP17953.1 oligosaccharide flippase family protein [Thiothrix lacustris]
MIIKIIKNTSWSLANQIIERGVLIIGSIIIARHFDTTDFAFYSFFYLTANMLSSYASIGLGVTSTKTFASIDGEVKNPLIGTIFLLAFISSIAFSILILLTFEKINLSTNNPELRWYLSIYVFIAVLVSILKGAVFGIEKFKQLFFVSLSASIFLSFLILYSTWSGEIKYSIYAVILHAGIMAIGCLYLIIKSLGFEFIINSFFFSSSHIFKTISFAGPMFLTSIIVSTGIWLSGLALLNGENGEYNFSVFSIGLQIFSLGILIPTQISNALVPSLVKMANKNDILINDEKKTLIRKILAVIFIISLLSIFTGWAGSDIVSAIYGEKYKITEMIVILFLLAAMWNSLSMITCNVLLTHNKQWGWLRLNLLWIIVLMITIQITKDNLNFFGSVALITSYIVLFISSLISLIKARLI